MPLRRFNLFVYGTLMDPSVFRAVTGRRFVTTAADADGVETFLARDALLEHHKKVSPDNTYLYAVPDHDSRIRGLVIGPLPPDCMAALLKYEGRNYKKRTVRVITQDKPVTAIAFVANLKKLEHSFGYAFRDPYKQEVLLRRKIEGALLATEQAKLQTDEPFTRRAVGELMGNTIRDLKRQHFEAGGISDYAIRQSLALPNLRDYTRALADPAAGAYASNYLAMLIRQVILNQIDDRIYTDFHYELDQIQGGTHYYDRAISALAALRMVNEAGTLLNILLGDAMNDLRFERDHLLDYVRWAVVAADAIYEARAARQEIAAIRSHMTHGLIPLGAELEFSNIGHHVILDPQGLRYRDRQYDGFIYFNDFALDVLTWKLGGHVDDHHEKASKRRRRGFFEIALGSVSIEANLSKPLTSDPWLLNQFIQEAMRFYDVQPHSVHISMQLRSQHRPVRDRLLPMSVMKCLYALAGDPVQAPDGTIQIRRLANRETVQWSPPPRNRKVECELPHGMVPRLLFSDISKRHSSDAQELSENAPHDRQATTGVYVQQYKFMRLSRELNYEVLALALKGVQLALSPGSFMTASQYMSSPEHREAFSALVEWGNRCMPLGESETTEFLNHVYDGLNTERRGKPAHDGAYIAWAMLQLRAALSKFTQRTVATNR